MKINRLLKKVNMPLVKLNHKVYFITDDSRECTENSVFIACKGAKDDGRTYIKQAIANGARTIISDIETLELPDINYIHKDNPKRVLALLLREFYHNVSRKLNLIGVIGTNGKTTTSTIAYELFNYVGKPSMLIGSNGIYYQGEKLKIDNTTPSITIIYEYLEKAKLLGINYVFMEVSSIAVSELRCLGLEFKVLIYTNFSEDHLDYHLNMDKYFEAKRIPFIKLRDKNYAIVNSDDEKYNEIIKFSTANILSYGINGGKYQIKPVMSSLNGIGFKYDDVLYEANMIGSFNMYNCASILALCDIFHISLQDYCEFLKGFTNVKGRMNKLEFDNKSIIIDYAHTEEAVKKVIDEVSKLVKNRLWIIIGCGGNREKEKRFHIGNYLNQIEARIILTSDNPRYEDPLDIIEDIKRYITKEVDIYVNREEAIINTLDKLNDNDCLLILGKGAEDYIEVKGVKYKYSDMEVCNEWIKYH